MVSVSSVANSAKNKIACKSMEKTFESMNDRVSFTIEPVPEKDDPYTETFQNQTLISGSKHNYYPHFEKHIENG